MKHPPATLADFSQFTVRQAVQESDRTLLSGKMTKPGRFSRGERLRIFISLKDDVPCYLTELNPDAGTGVLDVVTQHLHPAIVSGATFPLYDDQWYGKLHLAFDETITWRRMQFVAPDAFVETPEPPGWRKWRIATPEDQKRTDGQIVPGGWDHEHCDLCFQKIGLGRDPEGYVNGCEDWICVSCYNRFIAPHDLRFVLEGPWDDSDDSAGSSTAFRQIRRLIDDYDLAALRRFLDDTGSINARNKNGWTPLMLATSKGHQSLILLLLDAGADVNAISDQEGYTALALAAQKGFVDVVEKLLAAGANAQVPEKLCSGSLLKFVKTGPAHDNAQISKLLIEAGAK